MIFVMGRMDTYILDLENNGKAIKIGFRSRSNIHPCGFDGAYVFKTYEDADKFICEMSYKHEGFEVFGIDADWEKDTHEIRDKYWRALNEDKEYFSIPQKEK